MIGGRGMPGCHNADVRHADGKSHFPVRVLPPKPLPRFGQQWLERCICGELKSGPGAALIVWIIRVLVASHFLIAPTGFERGAANVFWPHVPEQFVVSN